MKDRTPKYPGRVKLEPVAGQKNIYDMTRADEPDDTGTPFNTRTMLQDSTGRFLKLPYANPLVDDALRHMPDRIEPIGTVKTSPALSLGDAWLPCDGSQVTFAEYPELCQLLRGTVSVEFDGAAFGVSGLPTTASDAVYFAGKWWVAVCKQAVGSGTNYYTYPITILSAEAVSGPWSVNFTVNKNAYGSPPRLYMACTEDICVLAFRCTELNNASERVAILYRRVTQTTWTFLPLTDYLDTTEVVGLAVHNGLFAIAYGDEAGGYGAPTVMYSSTPDVSSSWSKTLTINGLYAAEDGGSFTHANGYWILTYADMYNNGNGNLYVAYASDNSGFQFNQVTVTGTGIIKGVESTSKVVAYNNKFYILLCGYLSVIETSNRIVLASTTDFEHWDFQTLKNYSYIDDNTNYHRCAICANEKIMIIATARGAWSTSDPVAHLNEVILPAGFMPTQACFDDNTAIVVSASAVAYHDYSTDTRLLPTIALSDDTTTYIKAKKELDVFEAQESGGD